MENRFDKITIKKDRISDKIIAALEQALQDGILNQGDKLPTEEKLATQFQVSKVAVREALREMETRGLIRKERGMRGGNFISAPDVKRVGDSLLSCFQYGSLTEDEIIDFRQILEPVLIKTAVHRRQEADLVAMKANIMACEEELLRGETNVSRLIQFHILIAKACYNKLFVSVMEAIAEIFEGIAKPWEDDREKMQKDIEFNYRFYDCLVHRKEAEAEQLMKEHFEITKAFRKEDLEKAAQLEQEKIIKSQGE